MEFHQKIQALRKQKGLTQEELSRHLYVSRTAISKWESGRGYPNIESLKEIAKFFSLTVDELISTDEVLTIAEEHGKRKERHFRDLTYGLLDSSIAMLLFLPLFGEKQNEMIQSVSLIALNGVQSYLKILYLSFVIGMTLIGIMTLALQNCQAIAWVKTKTTFSLVSGAILILLFIAGAQPYAAVFSFVLLGIKTFILIKRP